jgi:hypothetical protein
MEIIQQEFDQALSQLVANCGGTTYIPKDIDDKVDKFYDFLRSEYNKRNTDTLLDHMEKNGIAAWSKIPSESSTYYYYFTHYLMLPASVRSKANMSRILVSLRDGTPVCDCSRDYLVSHQMYFWQERAYLFDIDTPNKIMETMESTQIEKLAAIRDRSVRMGSLSGDLAIEIMSKASNAIAGMDFADLSPNQLANMIQTAVKLAGESNRVSETALALSDLVATLDELEDLDDELRFIDAEVIDDGT